MNTADKVTACAFNLRHGEGDKKKAAKALRIALAELTVEMRREELERAADELEAAYQLEKEWKR